MASLCQIIKALIERYYTEDATIPGRPPQIELRYFVGRKILEKDIIFWLYIWNCFLDTFVRLTTNCCDTRSTYVRERKTILQNAKNLKARVLKIGRPCYTWKTTLEPTTLFSIIAQRVWEIWCRDRYAMKRKSKKILEMNEASDTYSTEALKEEDCSQEEEPRI